jgi:ubiquinone/menaquinone biosynthesis C-methylase UbiE
MVSAARAHPPVAYALGVAERLPFRGACFAAATVASGVHWFEQEGFFAEALRVLSSEGWIAIYDHYFLGEMEDVPEFGAWFRHSYVARYLTPARGRHFASGAEVPDGFQRIADNGCAETLEMDRAKLVAAYL